MSHQPVCVPSQCLVHPQSIHWGGGTDWEAEKALILCWHFQQYLKYYCVISIVLVANLKYNTRWAAVNTFQPSTVSRLLGRRDVFFQALIRRCPRWVSVPQPVAVSGSLVFLDASTNTEQQWWAWCTHDATHTPHECWAPKQLWLNSGLFLDRHGYIVCL